MAEEAFFVWDINTANNAPSAFNKAVNVKSVSDSNKFRVHEQGLIGG